MAWCENENCRKNGLRKEDIEFDDATRKVLCHGCMTLVHPGWTPPSEYVDLTSDAVPRVPAPQSKVGFAIQVTNEKGVQAQLSYGGVSIAFQAPMEDLKGLFGG